MRKVSNACCAPLRSARRCVLAAAALALGFALHSVPALALNAITCTGLADVYYTPGLTDTLQSTQVDTDENALCLSLSHPLLSSAHIESHFPATLSCESLLAAAPAGSTMIQWSDSTTSIFSWTPEDVTLVRLEAHTVITKMGQVVAGRFSGKSILENRVLLNVDLDACSASGVDHIRGNNTFSIY